MRMTMTRSRMAGLTAMLAALALAMPGEARAQDFTPDLYTCAALYDVLDAHKRSQQAINSGLSGPGLNDLGGHQSSLWREAGAFWAFSNARLIDFGARRDALKERSGDSDLGFDIQARGTSGSPRFPSPTSEAAGFPRGPVTSATRPPPVSETPPYGQWISACDREHGFRPVFSFGVIEHLECVTHYWTMGALRRDLQPATTPRLQQAARAYARATPGTTEDDIRSKVVPLVRTRGQQIQGGQDSFEALIADIDGCDAQYGLAPIIP